MARCIACQSSGTARPVPCGTPQWAMQAMIGVCRERPGRGIAGGGRSRGRQQVAGLAAPSVESVDPWDCVYWREQLGDVVPAFR